MPHRANKAWEKQNGKEDLEEVQEDRSDQALDRNRQEVTGLRFAVRASPQLFMQAKL
jgi:hypothetical protein